jgi:hypothetical protein
MLPDVSKEMLQKEIHLDALQLDDDTKYFVYLLNFIILWTNNGEEWVEPDCKALLSIFLEECFKQVIPDRERRVCIWKRIKVDV